MDGNWNLDYGVYEISMSGVAELLARFGNNIDAVNFAIDCYNEAVEDQTQPTRVFVAVRGEIEAVWIGPK